MRDSGADKETPADSVGEPTLFPLPSPLPPAPRPLPSYPRRGVRLREANRGQLSWGPIDVDSMLPQDHPARAIWAVVDQLDLSALYVPIQAREEVAGAPAIDPKVLLALWVYGTSDGEGSAREIWRLTTLHTAYRWICGGVDIGYHTISDFRSQQAEVIDALITQVLTLLLHQDLVDLHRVAQDGTRVRASAGASSFRRGQTLDTLMAEARKHLAAVQQDAVNPELTARQAAARRRGAEDRLARLEAAVGEIPAVTAVKARSGAKDKAVRVSTTDPEARVMKMGDGGFRPAYNVQLATTTDRARVIVGVQVSNSGSDQGLSTPMLDEIERRTGQRPAELLADGGYNAHEAIDHATEQGTTCYMPLPAPRKGDARDPHEPRAHDSTAVAAWRGRMATDEAKTIYRQRAATAETVNADAKTHRGLNGLSVRGQPKVQASASLFVLTYNILRLITLTG
jgi:transposase